MIEHGMGGDDLEKALQEEENKTNEQQESTQEKQEPNSEAITEINNEQLTQEIGQETNKAEMNESMFEKNLEAVGGKEGLEKTWSVMDESKKAEIVQRIAEYSKNKKKAIEHQKDGLDFINPVKVYGGESNLFDTNTVIGNLLTGTVTYWSGVPVVMGGFELVRGTYNRIKNAMAIGKEKRNLSKLEKQYQL